MLIKSYGYIISSHATIRAIAILTTAVIGAWVLPAQAQTSATGAPQNWPAKPIRVLVPYPAGGTSDILTRLIGAKLTEVWGQQVIADSRPGANGNIAVEMLARSAPDGYTLTLMDIGNLSISPSMYTKLPFDIIRDLAPITTVTFSPYLLTTHPSVPVKTVAELIALAKKNPGKLNAPTGLGSNIHLSTLPGFTLPGDVSASQRYWTEDIITPEVEVTAQGKIARPMGVGLGYEVNEKRIEALTVRTEVITP